MPTPLIAVKGLAKTYRMGQMNVYALKHLDLTIERGEFVAIMGPSGSGKSTFMNLVGCLDTPTSGSYLLDGIEVANLTDDELAAVRSRKIGFVFQTFNLIARTSALANVQIPLYYNRARRASSAENEAAAYKALSIVGLKERADHKPNELSGGQQQRVAIARSLVNNPAVILADEPTGALDTRTGEEIMAIFQRLNRAGKTVVMVTHEPDIAQHAGRIIQFRDGNLISDEKVAEPLNAANLLKTMPTENFSVPVTT